MPFPPIRSDDAPCVRPDAGLDSDALARGLVDLLAGHATVPVRLETSLDDTRAFCVDGAAVMRAVADLLAGASVAPPRGGRPLTVRIEPVEGGRDALLRVVDAAGVERTLALPRCARR